MERLAAYEAAPTTPIAEMDPSDVTGYLENAASTKEGLGLRLNVHGFGRFDFLCQQISEKIENGSLTAEDITAYFAAVVTMPVDQAANSDEPVINVLQVPSNIFKERTNFFEDQCKKAGRIELAKLWSTGYRDARFKWKAKNVRLALLSMGDAGPRASFVHIVV